MEPKGRFQKLVAIEPLRLLEEDLPELNAYAKEVVLYSDIPSGPREVIYRIGDADAALLSVSSRIEAEVLASCPKLRYIGMCCSLYDPNSANVDIEYATKKNIVVKGVMDYGDEGVREYVVSELASFLLGLHGRMWRAEATELTGLHVGVLGLGTTGTLVAEALRFFGAEVRYFSRTPKPALEQTLGLRYAELENLLPWAEVLVCCLRKNTILLGQHEFEMLGDGKILMNISIGPAHDVAALENWLNNTAAGGNTMLGDTPAAVDPSGKLLSHPRVICSGKSAGMTRQAKKNLAQKVCQNMQAYWEQQRDSREF